MASPQQHDPDELAQTKGPTAIAISVAFVALSSLVLSLRLYVRCGILKTAGLDDWTMLAAQLMAIIVSIATCLEVKYGLGRHTWAVPADQVMHQLQFLYTNIVIYNLAMNVIKISFLVQYRRIFQSELIRRICFWVMAYVVVWAVVQDLVLGLTCVPLSFLIPSTASWCLDTLPLWYFSSAMSIASDAAIFTIPLPSVWNLQLPRKQRLLVFGIFCLGFFVCIISVVRILSLHNAVITQDPSWDNTEAAWWSVIELNCAILCSSLPTLRPLLARIIPALASTRRDGRGYGYYGSNLGAASRKDAQNTTTTTNNNTNDTASSRAADAGHKPGTSRSSSPQPNSDELALYDIEAGQQQPVVYAECTAGGRAGREGGGKKLEGVAEKRQSAGGRSTNQILVTTETRTEVIQSKQ